MDPVEAQKGRRRRGIVAVVLAMLLLMIAVRQASMRQIRPVDFILIYFSGVALGAGLAMIVASFRTMREINSTR